MKKRQSNSYKRLIYECRCDEIRKAKAEWSTSLAYTVHPFGGVEKNANGIHAKKGAQPKSIRQQTRTANLPLRRRTPYPLGQTDSTDLYQDRFWYIFTIFGLYWVLCLVLISRNFFSSHRDKRKMELLLNAVRSALEEVRYDFGCLHLRFPNSFARDEAGNLGYVRG